jgi:hypothetical protein
MQVPVVEIEDGLTPNDYKIVFLPPNILYGSLIGVTEKPLSYIELKTLPLIFPLGPLFSQMLVEVRRIKMALLQVELFASDHLVLLSAMTVDYLHF